MSNFKDFISKYSIQIPLIQRDYVQGSDVNEKKRDDFLNSLLDALKGGDTATLDFIYGTIDEKRSNTMTTDSTEKIKVKCFEPLDGQQRLTTLSLLFWILRKRTKVPCDTSIEENVKNFSYKTRISSTKFCEKLFSEERELPTENGLIAKFIKNLEWYSDDWDLDPTVKAMLQMLDVIDKVLSNKYKNDIEIIAKNFYGDGNNNKVEFDELDMGKYNLTDGLYIKMNARGKQLTEFENWKASFIKFLSTKFPNENFAEEFRGDGRKEFCKYKDYFEQSMEHKWTDMLWPDAYKNWEELKDDDEKKQTYPVIDGYFINLYKYLFKMLYFANTDRIKYIDKEDNSEKERDVIVKDFDPNSKEIINEILGKKENIDFMFRAIDFFCNIDRDKFFKELFYSIKDDKILDSRKVRLFDTNNDINLFKQCIIEDDSDINVKSQIMLYCIIKYCLKYSCIEVNHELKKYVRVCRNLLESINQRLGKDVVIRPNIRLNDLKKYDAAIKLLIKCKNVHDSLNSLDKAELKSLSFGNIECEIKKLEVTDKDNLYNIEDISFIRGNLTVFDDDNIISAGTTFNALKEFMKCDDIQRIQLLIASGFMGETFGYCKHGERIFWGGNNRWDIIFMTTNEKNIAAINKYIKSYKDAINKAENDIVGNIISKAMPSNRNFTYYALKYRDFISATTKEGWSLYYFSVNGTLDDLDIIALGSYSINPLLAYHTEPFASAVATTFKNGNPKIYDDLNTNSIYSDRAHLEIMSKKLRLLSESDGWHITSTDEDSVPTLNASIISKFYINNYVLPDMQGKDKIETAIDFINEIYK